MTTITIDQVSKFLLGEAPLDGAWFGDKHPSKRGAFWWREYLRAALAAQPSQPAHTEAQRGEPDFYPHGIAHLAPPLDINSNQIAQLWALVEAGNEDVDDPTVFRLQHKLPGKDTDGEPAPGGLYVWVAEYPEEGMIFLDPDSAPQPEMTTEREAFEVWHAEWRARVSAREPSATEAWFAACALQKEKDAKLCEAYAIDRHALYKGKPPYTGKEPQRYDPHTEGASDAADLLADKIRGRE